MSNTSPRTTRYGVLAAVGTGVAVLGTTLATGASTTPSAPTWLPGTGLVLAALGGALTAAAQALGGYAQRDNDVSDERAGAKPPRELQGASVPADGAMRTVELGPDAPPS